MTNLLPLTQILPPWGPYSKKYMGVSRVLDAAGCAGGRFDCVVHPTIANSNVPLPNVTVPSGYHPWSAANDLSYYSYRYDLEWKDQVYADVSFTKMEGDAVLIRTEFVNHTALEQNCLLNIFCALEFPYAYQTRLNLPKHCVLLDALQYSSYAYAVQRPWDSQNPDGMKKGQFLDPAFYQNQGLGDRVDHAHAHYLQLKPFGAAAGDSVTYHLAVDTPFVDAVLAVRYRTVSPGNGMFQWDDRTLCFPASEELAFAYFSLGQLDMGNLALALTALSGGAGIELDCLIIAEQIDKEQIEVVRVPHAVTPHLATQAQGAWCKAQLTYPELAYPFEVITHNLQTRYRKIDSGSLEDALISRLSNGDCTFDEVTCPFTASFSKKHSDPGFYHNTLVHSIYLPKNSRHIEYVVVSQGAFSPMEEERYEALYREACSRAEPAALNQAGQPYALSNEILRSTLLTNIVYPIYRHGTYILHHTPGKRWDSLYTWDSGFIGLGLLETEPALAEYILKTYLSEPDNPDFAFLHHGSPVPVQFYLFHALLGRAADQAHLLAYYDALKRYYDFLSGKSGGSATGKFHSGLTTTYDYFYSSSGMDDYPAQHEMIAQKLEAYACPCISTSQVIRCAKLLYMAADALHRTADMAQLEHDIAAFTTALRRQAWDEACGYFSYVLHNDAKEPVGIFRTQDGVNLNRGMDGIYPLIAGACTTAQQQRLLAHLKSPDEMWSPVGISAVDQSAPYYKPNGYWSGNVWFSHQWFLWKTMLDLHEPAFAFQIADTALKVWAREVDHSYYTFEMIHIETGRGGWFHHFGGLSAPVNIWMNAYYKPGTFTAGLDVWTDAQVWDASFTSLKAQLRYYGTQASYTVLAVLDDRWAYDCYVNGTPTSPLERVKGAYELTIDGSVPAVQIQFKRK